MRVVRARAWLRARVRSVYKCDRERACACVNACACVRACACVQSCVHGPLGTSSKKIDAIRAKTAIVNTISSDSYLLGLPKKTRNMHSTTQHVTDQSTSADRTTESARAQRFALRLSGGRQRSVSALHDPSGLGGTTAWRGVAWLTKCRACLLMSMEYSTSRPRLPA